MSKTWTQYDFDDHIWKKNGEWALLAMTNFVAQSTIGGWWVRNPRSKLWEEKDNEKEARKYVSNTYLGSTLKTGDAVTAAMIEEFFTGYRTKEETIGKKVISTKELIGANPILYATQFIPNAPRYIEYKGRKFLNTAYVEYVKGDDAHLKAGKALLVMVYKSLCAAEDPPGFAVSKGGNYYVELGDYLWEAIKNDVWWNLDYRFALMWLAAIYQEPGINLLTNLWIIGDMQGVGKGTLVEVMKLVLGSSFVNAFNQDEIENGWTDFIYGSVLIECDEFDTQNSKRSPSFWNKWVKRNTIASEVQLRRRNKGVWQAVNVSNYIFTTNDESPIYLDQTDRRNFLIKTTDDIKWRDYATGINVGLVQANPEAAAQGWARILHEIKIDHAMLRTAPINNAKQDVQMDSLGPVGKWVLSAPHELGKWRSATDLHTEFSDWCRRQDAHKHEKISLKGFGNVMTALKSKGLVDKRSVPSGREYAILRQSIDTNTPTGVKPSDAFDGAIAALGVAAPVMPADTARPVEGSGREVDPRLAAIRAVLRTKENDDEPI